MKQTLILLLLCVAIASGQESGIKRAGARSLGGAQGVTRAVSVSLADSIQYKHGGATSYLTSIAQVNALSMSAGDTIAFPKGSIWRERLVPPTSGTAANPIVFTSYGTGAKPIINGSTVTTGWTLNSAAVYSKVLSDSARVVVEDDTILTYRAWLTSVAVTFSTDSGAVAGCFSVNHDTVYAWLRSSANPSAHTMQVSYSTDQYTGIGIYVSDKSYITIDGLTVCNSAYEGIRVGAHVNHDVTTVVVQNCTVFYNGSVGIMLYNSNETNANNPVLACRVYKDTVFENRCHGIQVANNIRTSTIDHNLSHHNGWNYPLGFHGISSWGYDSLCGPDGNTFEYNESHHTYAPNGDEGAGIQMDGNTKNSIVRYNICHDNMQGPGLAAYASYNNTFCYNVSYNNEQGITLAGNYVYAKIYNNTIYNNWGKGIPVAGDNPHVSSVIKNNICYQNGPREMDIYTTGMTGVDTIDYNCFFHSAGGTFMYYGHWDAYNWADYRTASGQDAHSINADPLFVDTAGHDFHLQVGSPAINAGVNVGLTQDLAGNAIVALPDLGAYETTTAAWVITASAGANGTISPDGPVAVTPAANKKFTITPSGGYNLDTLKVDGAKVDSTTSFTFVSVGANHTISATFKAPDTLATVVTVDATSIAPTTATLNGTVDPNSSSTATSFAWGTSSTAPSDSGAATPTPVTGTTATAISKAITGLTAGTKYYFKAVGSNAAGYVRGSLDSLTTTYPPIAFSDVDTSVTTSAATKQWTHTIAGNYLLVGVENGNTRTLDSVKVWQGAGAKTKLAPISEVTTTPACNLWGVKAPPIGLDTIQAWWHTGACQTVCVSASYTNVNQTTPIGTAATNTATGTAVTDTVVAASTSDLVVGIAIRDNGSTFTATGTGMVKRREVQMAQGTIAFVDMPGANGNVVLIGTWGNSHFWRMAGVALKPQ